MLNSLQCNFKGIELCLSRTSSFVRQVQLQVQVLFDSTPHRHFWRISVISESGMSSQRIGGGGRRGGVGWQLLFLPPRSASALLYFSFECQWVDGFTLTLSNKNKNQNRSWLTGTHLPALYISDIQWPRVLIGLLCCRVLCDWLEWLLRFCFYRSVAAHGSKSWVFFWIA